MDDPDPVPGSAASVEEYGTRLIREAIAMVASGGAPRVIVAGVPFDEPGLDPARRLALEAGVRLVARRRPDDRGADVAIERIRG
jgi:hypothetical protein